MEQQYLKCKKCGHTIPYQPGKSDKAFAKNTNSPKLFVVWDCEKCGENNASEVTVL